jgi:hypothetical protein
MGIPVQEIDCKYSIDVQQKVPLGTDRETVLPSFLKDLYAEVLNQTYEEVKGEESSSVWIRQAFTSDRVEKSAVKEIVNERYGDKVVIADPFNPVANDDAIANGYRVIRGAELSKEEWGTIKEADKNLIPSSTSIFGKTTTNNFETVPFEKLTKGQKYMSDLAKKITKEFLGFDLTVVFIRTKENLPPASFQLLSNVMTVNLSKVGKGFFKELGLTRFYYDNMTVPMLDLIIHEVCHKAGNHTEHSYHQAITKLGAELTWKALHEADWFNL